jgi:hypothetical protein
MDQALQAKNLPFEHVTVEVYTQVELCLNVVFATVPSLQIFLASVHTGLLDLGVATNDGTYSSRSGYRSSQRGKHTRPEQHGPEDEIELTRTDMGTSFTTITAGQRGNKSIHSASSDTGIVVKQTVDIQ